MATQSGNDSPLHSAVRLGQLEEVRKILDEPDVDVNCLNSNHETPIHLACELGNSRIIELLISFDANVFIKDSYNRDYFDISASLEVCNLVHKLLYSRSLWLKGPTLITENDTPLHDTVKLGQLTTVQDILEQKSQGVNDKNSAHETPLHLACAIGHNGIVRMLLTNGAICSMYARDSYNNAPVHRAASMGHISIVDVLITVFGCDPTIRGYQGRSLLHFACGSGDIKFVEMVIQRKWLDPIIDRDACGFTPLHIAALCGHDKVTNMLVAIFNCSVDFKNEGAETPLHVACANGHINVVKLLVISHNADLNAKNFQNNSPLLVAAMFGHTNVIKTLINDFNCDPNETGFEGATILHVACMFGHVELVEILITDFGLDPMCVDDDEYTPFQLAAMLGHTNVIKTLINKFNCNPKEDTTILHLACENGHVDIAQALITEFGLDPMCVDDFEYTPLHYAASGGHLSVVRMLVSQHNADPNAYNKCNISPLQKAAEGGHTSIVKVLINDFNCNPNEKGLMGRNILHIACNYGRVELAETLISDFGFDPMCVDTYKDTPLHCAVEGGHLNVVKMLLSQHNTNLNACNNNENYSPLELAAKCGHTRIVNVFINDYNCNPNKKGFKNRTILHLACQNGHVELAETLITDFGLDPMCVDYNWDTPLHYAASSGHLNVVRMLVSQHNAKLNTHNNGNNSPLQLAAKCGHTNIVKVMINDFKCDKNEKRITAITILHLACENGHVELADTLITDFGLDPMCVDYGGDTPLHYAARGCHLGVVKMLVSQHNADLNARNYKNDSPLQLAAREGYTDIVKVLINELNHRANVEGLQSQAALIAFAHACENGYEELAITLIADLVCLTPLSTDNYGNTLLHIAAMHEQEQCVSLLLFAYNSPIYLRNYAGKTAREMTKSSYIRTLIDGYLKQNQGSIQANYKELQLLSLKKYSGEQRLTRVFVVGNIMSGKSTLIESLKREGFFVSRSQVSENTVPLHTSGIVPSVHNSKTIGRILYYDFAGDPEYYSSHSAIISNVMWSKVGTNVFLCVINFSKDIQKIQEELGYWLSFISYHNRNVRNMCTVVVIGSHTDLITAVGVDNKIERISTFVDTHFAKSSTVNFQIHNNILTSNCRQPKSTQCIKDAIAQISKDTPPYNLSLEAAILLGLLEKDFKNVVTCKFQDLVSHIKETGICLPSAAESLYPLVEQLHHVGLLMIIGSRCDKLEDHILLLKISKLTNEVHELLFCSEASDSDDNTTGLYANMGVLPQRYLNSILPKHITTDCLVQLQYCQPFSHVEVKVDYIAPSESEDPSSPTLFYFPALCKTEKKEGITTPQDFDYYIGCYINCKVNFDYFPPRFLHILLLRLAYCYALQVPHENACTDSEPNLEIVLHYNRRCTMWKNGIHWLMEKGVECFVEMVNNSKGIVIVTKSKETQKSICIEMLFKIMREIQEAKEEFCDPVTLQHYLMNSDDPASFNDEDKLFYMSEVERVLREGTSLIVSIKGHGHLDSKKIHHLMKCTLWSKL